MKRSVQGGLAVVASLLFGGCLSTDAGTESGGDCRSFYSDVTEAATWPALKDALLGSDEWPAVVAVRVQEHGTDVGVGDRDAVRIVDLLDERRRRVVQLEVWRTDRGGWSAGSWNQCID